MKKLLAILGSISMVSSLTTLVVACGGNSTTTKQDLTSLGVLPLGVFEDTPDDQAILDAFNVKSLLNLNLVLTTDVTITDKTINGATIISNPDSILCTGSTTVTFTIKKDLNDYEKQEFTIDKKEPDVNDILTMFNKANDISLVLGIDVTIKINIDDKKATITALPASEKVKGEVKVTFDSRIFLGNINLEPFKYLNEKPKDKDEVLVIINQANPGLDLKLGDDLIIDFPTLNGVQTNANNDSNKVTGSRYIDFTYKPKLDSYQKDITNKFNKRPSAQEVLNEFNELNSLKGKDELILNKDVTIESIENTEAKIIAVETSQKVQGKVDVNFKLKTDINDYTKNISTKFDGIPKDWEVLKAFNARNEDKTALILNTDVTINQITSTSARMIANPNSPEYTGEITIDFALKTDIKTLFDETNLKNIPNRTTNTLFAKIKQFNSNVIGLWSNIEAGIDSTVLNNSYTKDKFVISMKDSDLYVGRVEFTFNILFTAVVDENITVFIDESGAIETSDVPIKNERQITHILQIGYDKNSLVAHRVPKTTKYVPNDISSKIKSLYELFYDCRNFNDSAISKWNVYWITNMSRIFILNKSFNVDISKWDVSNVTDMSWMFYAAYNFNQDISGWKTSKVTDMYRMFNYTKAFNKDISKWDVSSLTSMFAIFQYSEAFNQDLSQWNVSSVTDMSWMFFEAKKFNNNGVPLNWGNKTKKVIKMDSMFGNAISFNQDLSGWDVSNVTTHNGFATGIPSENTGFKPPNFKSKKLKP